MAAVDAIFTRFDPLLIIPQSARVRWCDMNNATSICGAEERAAVRAGLARRPRFESGAIMRPFGFENSRASSDVSTATGMPNELQVGQVLDGRFKVLDVVNRGGMASVYQARDGKTGEIVALKVPFAQYESDPEFLSRFQREEHIGLTLEHPGIVSLVPAAEKSRPYIVMEYLEGETLAARLHEEKRLPEGEAVRIASRICEGLEYLHRKGVVHRDLKPENVMLCNDGSIRILDFGIAKSRLARRLTFGGFSPAMGTPEYIAPEQVQGKRGDGRSDIYALGAILYEMTTGSTPYEGDNPLIVLNARLAADPEAPRSRNPQLSPQIEEIILHAMERNPSERYASAAAMRAELNNYSEVLLTERSKRLRPPQLWKARVPLGPKIAALVVLQAVVFFLLFWWFSHRNHANNAAPRNQPGVVDTGGK
jgi:serine/threonine-protein kinase